MGPIGWPGLKVRSQVQYSITHRALHGHMHQDILHQENINAAEQYSDFGGNICNLGSIIRGQICFKNRNDLTKFSSFVVFFGHNFRNFPKNRDVPCNDLYISTVKCTFRTNGLTHLWVQFTS